MSNGYPHRITCFTILQFILIIITSTAISSESDPNVFPELDIIKGNVAFWKKIYSEVSLTEGLIHDKDYPLVIYEKIDLSGKTEKEQTEQIDSRKKFYSENLSGLDSSSGTNLTEQKKILKQLVTNNAGSVALKGAGERVRFQRGQKERFRAGLERSALYLDTIIASLKKYGLPEQLKYLPHVESSFDPEAYSRVGAAGLWQFMSGTGKLFLKVNYEIDERFDPFKSTEAAVKLLKLNYQQLQAWPLAITAYNYGLAGMKRAAAASGSNDLSVIIQKHESPTFKFASKNFYASFVAASQLADSTEKYFEGLALLKSPKTVTRLINERATPAKICDQFGISIDEFKIHNPAVRPVVYSQKRLLPAGYTINLPESIKSKKQQVAFNDNQTRQPVTDLDNTGYYTVTKGDNLQRISKRLGIQISQLVSLNSIEKIDRIYEGQVLRIPNTFPISDAIDQIVIVNGDSSSKTILFDTLPSSTEIIVALGNSSADTVNTLQDSSNSLIIENQNTLDTSFTSPAVKLTDSYKQSNTTKDASLEKFDAGAYDLGLEIVPGAINASVKVNVGESIIRYAEWMNISAASIMQLNEMRDTQLRIGQKILLPIGPKSDPKKFETNRIEYWMAIEEDFYSRYQVTELVERTLRKGDNMWKICNVEQIPIWLLKKYNRSINITKQFPDTKILVPRIVAKSVHVPPSIIPQGDSTIISPDQ